MEWTDNLPDEPADVDSWEDIDNQLKGVHVPDTPPADWGTPVIDTPEVRGFYTLADLAALPEPKPFIERAIEEDTIVVVGGETGSYKSFFVLGMACAVAAGVSWRHRKTTQRKVLMVVGEGERGIAKRVSAWQKENSSAIDPESFCLLAWDFSLLDSEHTFKLVDLIQRHNFGMVVIDTLSQAIPGVNENDAGPMSQATSNMKIIRRATNGGVVVVTHHTLKSDKADLRGSGALRSNVDTVFMLQKSRDRHVEVTNQKRKDGETLEPFEMEFHEVPECRSGVLVDAYPLAGGEGVVNLSEAMQLFEDHFKFTGASSREAKEMLVERLRVSDVTAKRRLNELVGAGRLKNVGTERTPFYKISY